MENVPQHIDEIRRAFTIMKDKSDLVNVLNMAKRHLYGEKAKDFQLKSITYYANPRLAKERYQVFQIPKKSGGLRTIHAPVVGLKAILRCLNFIFQSVCEKYFTSVTTGFVPGKSIVDNARRHTGKQFVFNLDLKDFFPSVDLYRVKAVLCLSPFNLKDEREPLAYLIANLCCQVMDVERANGPGEMVTKSLPVLPQGAPTSPILSNIVCYRLDRHLQSIAKRFGATYSRYADDITFSGNYDIYKADGNFVKEVRRVITEERFVVNEKKVRIQRPWFRQEVTGLIVNKNSNVPRDYVKQVRQWLYFWETYGYVKAEILFKKGYLGKAGGSAKLIPPMERVLEGKLLYMRMVVGKGHPTYKKLWERFEELIGERAKPDAIKKAKSVKHSNITPETKKNRNENGITDTNFILQNIFKSAVFSPDFDFLLQNNEIEKYIEGKRLLPLSGQNILSALKRVGDGEKYSVSDDITGTNFYKEPNKSEKLVIKKLKEHNPQNTSNLLDALYKDPIIKAALHKWDDVERPDQHPLLVKEFNHSEFIKALKSRVNALKKRFLIGGRPKGLDTKIGYFFVEENLFTKKKPDDKGWSMDKVLISWNSEEMQEWCKNHPGKWPAVYSDVPYFGLIFDPPKKFGLKIYSDFGEIIQKFIHEIRFKKTEYLNNDPKYFFDILFNSDRYDVENLITEGIEFYADVEKFRQGIDCIRRGIDENISKSKKIILRSHNSTQNIIIEIHHINSEMDKDIVSFYTHFGNIIGQAKELLIGVCDWHIEAKFPNGCFRFPVLVSTNEEEIVRITTDNNDIGVKHIFTFYRPKR